MTNKKIFLFVMAIVVLIISISAVSAADISGNDTISSSDITHTSLEKSTNTQKIIKEESNMETAENTNNIQTQNAVANHEKTKDDKNIKTAGKTIVITNKTFNNYFDADNTLTDSVSAGDTLDFQGNFIGNQFAMIINKPVNIIASKGNSYINIDTVATSDFGDEEVAALTLTRGASYSNITGIYLYNSQFFIRNAHHITINNITTYVKNQQVGAGVGQVSIRDNSSFITVENCSFTSENNGGRSTLVLAWAVNCTIRNNKVTGIGNVGNLIYLTTYNVEGISELQSLNNENLIENNTLIGPDTPQSICYGIGIAGERNKVYNNVINYTGIGITTQWITSEAGLSVATDIRNNVLNGCKLIAPENGTVVNNTVNGELVFNPTSQIYNNTIQKVSVKSGTVLTNNIINGNVEIPKSTTNVTIANCTVKGNITTTSDTSSSTIPSDITVSNVVVGGGIYINGVNRLNITNNTIADTINITSKRGNLANNIIIENNTIVTDEEYAIAILRPERNITIKNNILESSNNKEGADAIYVNDVEGSEGLTIADNPISSQIKLNQSAKTVYVNDNVTITGVFTVSSTPTKVNSVTIYDNNKKITTVSSNNNGVFTYTYKLTTAGSHNITAKFDGNTTYQASQDSVMVTVNNPVATAVSLKANATSVYVNDKVLVSGNLTASGRGIAGKVSVSDNGVKVADVTASSNGAFSYTYSAVSAGSHNLSFAFAGNNSHMASQSGVVVTVNNPVATAVSLKANSTSVYVNDKVLVSGNLTASGRGIAGKVSVSDNGVKVADVTASSNGAFSYTYSAVSAGSHNLAFAFAGNNSHMAAQSAVSITVNNPQVTNIALNANSSEVYVNDVAVVTGNFTSSNNALSGKLTVTDNGVALTNITVPTNGIFTYNYNALTTGNHTLTFAFAGNNSHQSTESNIIIKVEAKPTEIIMETGAGVYVTDVLTIYAKLKLVDEDEAIPFDSIKVYDNDEELNEISSGGEFTFSYVAEVVGEHTIKFVFAGNNSHAPSEAKLIIDVLEPRTTNMSLTSDNDLVYVNDQVVINGVFTTNDIASHVEGITVYLNNEQVDVISTDDEGKFNYSYVTQSAGNDIVKFVYEGDISRKASEASIAFEVNAMKTKIVLDPLESNVYNVTDKIDITGYFAFEDETEGTYVDSINVYDNNVLIATVGPTGEDGKFTYQYAPSKPGTHEITFKYVGNNTHAQSQESVELDIKGYVLKMDTTEFAINTTATIQASIYFDGELSTDINTGKVAFKVNGKTLKDENGKVIYAKIINGTAKIEYFIDDTWKDNITIQAVSGASIQAQALKSDLERVSIIKEDTYEEPSITTEAVTAKKGDTVQFTATITDNGKVINTGRAIFKVNGKTLKDDDGKIIYATIVNNQVSIEYTIPDSWKAKEYKLEVVYTSPDYRLNSTSTLTVVA